MEKTVDSALIFISCEARQGNLAKLRSDLAKLTVHASKPGAAADLVEHVTTLNAALAEYDAIKAGTK